MPLDTEFEHGEDVEDMEGEQQVGYECTWHNSNHHGIHGTATLYASSSGAAVCNAMHCGMHSSMLCLAICKPRTVCKHVLKAVAGASRLRQ